MDLCYGQIIRPSSRVTLQSRLRYFSEIYDYIYSYLECLQNAEQAAQDISMMAGKLNVKLAINILAQEMVNEVGSVA